MIWISWFVVGVVISLWVWISLLFDRLVRYHHDYYYEDWFANGRPRGYFYIPANSQKIFTGMPLFRYVSQFRKELPQWAKEDEGARNLIKQYFFWEKVWKVAVIAAVPIIAVVSI